MKQNSCSVVREIAKPSRISLDQLDCTVEAFCTGVADSVLTVVEQPVFMAPEHLDYLFDRLKLAAHGIIRPCIKESGCSSFIAVAPKLGEVLLDAPRPTRLQVELVQSPKRYRFATAPVRVPSQPRPFTARQRRGCNPRQRSVLLLSHPIHCFTKILGDMKLVMHDVSLRHALFGSTHVRRPHVHGHSLDRQSLLRRELSQQSHHRFKLSLGHQIQHPGAINVVQDRGVGVPTCRTLLVNPNVAISSSVRLSIPRSTALSMIALTVLQDSRVRAQTA